MKKCICIILICALFWCCSPVVNAIESSEDISQTMNNVEYGFSYTEQVKDDYSIVRVYEKSQQSKLDGRSQSSIDQTEYVKQHTKAVLCSLGMGEEFIEQLSDEDITEYGASERITSIKAYLKTDAEGNVISIDEEEAMTVKAAPGVEEDIFDGDGGFPFWYEIDRDEDGYMEITYIVSYRGNGRYKFSIDAVWLMEPLWRLNDSLGACAQNFAIENNTRSGWYMYDQTTSMGGSKNEFLDQKVILSNFQNAEGPGNWDGSAVVFDLMDDFHVIGSANDYTIYRNHRIHYEFEATIHQWQVTTNFNATATYTHTQIAIQGTPTVSIGTSGVDVSIGITPVGASKKYSVDLPSSISHVP